MEVQRNLGYKCSIYKCFQWVVVGTLKVNLRSPDTQEKEEEEEQKKKNNNNNNKKKKKRKRRGRLFSRLLCQTAAHKQKTQKNGKCL